jgi:hypothetical protein
MNGDQAERALHKLALLSTEATNLVPFWQACTEVLAEAVPHYLAPCWFTLDPASLLITSNFHFGLVEFPAQMLTHEYYGEDVYHLADVVRSHEGIRRCTRPRMAILQAATDGS